MIRLSQPARMDGRVFLVTGASDGIGKHTALRLAQTGATVLMHGRETNKLPQAVNEIFRETGNMCLEAYTADLSTLSQVRALSEEIHRKHGRLDVLVNNAGVFMPTRTETEDGYEMTFAVNVLAPFMLTSLLMDLLQAGDSSRIVHVSSALHREYQTMIRIDELKDNNNNNNNNWTHSKGRQSYAQSKLCEVLYTYKMAEVLGKDANVTVNCLHPGRVNTNLLKQAWEGKKTGISLEEADLVFRAATDPALDGVTGRYFEDGKDTTSSDIS
ncbi:retinol dehydrogenase 14-like [Patiria miniata]|uniref:Short-chain dehydrogenase n=1 Tax=Patiria miniata TaxID=46514 RepID=A0A913ZCT6_PATMI|nr:retinol dehydrogenase 14-like [Patiria miniata]